MLEAFGWVMADTRHYSHPDPACNPDTQQLPAVIPAVHAWAAWLLTCQSLDAMQCSSAMLRSLSRCCSCSSSLANRACSATLCSRPSILALSLRHREGLLLCFTPMPTLLVLPAASGEGAGEEVSSPASGTPVCAGRNVAASFPVVTASSCVAAPAWARGLPPSSHCGRLESSMASGRALQAPESSTRIFPSCSMKAGQWRALSACPRH